MARPAFYPAQLNLSLVQTIQRMTPWLARLLYQLDLVISTAPAVQMAELRNSPCLFLCNHPTFDDPLVMFLVSAVVRQPFHYLAAYERFGGLKGWLLQQIGAYSIRRGQADRDSVAYTLKLLARPDCKLVIFPEGGCSFQNDTVMPFRPGAVQMALQAVAKRVKQGDDREFCLMPISLKYRYSERMEPILERSLSRLETELGLPGLGGSFYERLRRVAATVMGRFEQEYDLTPSDPANWNQRISDLKAQVLTQCEQRLNLAPAAHELNRERVYRIQHSLAKRYQLGEDGSNRIFVNGADQWEVMRQSLARVLNFDAIYDGYVSERPTPERFLDTVTRLERSVFNIDQPPPKGHRQAFVRIGQPVQILPYLAEYERNRSATVTALTEHMQQTVQQNLNLLSDATARDISW
ncbi:MAG: lysophospholipid acyltransferase family protein [Elainella sp.]